MEPIIITAFWDVGRGGNCAIPRSNERYYKEFEAWAKIKNKMIIYTDSNSCKVVESIREKYGLLERTKIIEIKNIFEVEQELYLKMKSIEMNENSINFKYFKNAMSNRADFDYAWMMKYWCMADARKYADDNTLFAWMDFGFNHIDNCYINMNEFDFLWECDVDMNKIHIFSLMPLDKIDAIDTLQYQFDTIMGVFHLVPADKAEQLWKLIKKSINALIMLGCIDDDQQLLLMSYKAVPEIFEVHISKWFMPLKEFGAKHLTVREDNKHKKNINTLLRERVRNRKMKGAFYKRMYERTNKFY